MSALPIRQIYQSNTYIPDRLFYTVNEVKILLGVETDKAYRVIRDLRKELVEKGYAEYPAGKIPKKYFLERYFMDEKEAENVLQQMSAMRSEPRPGGTVRLQGRKSKAGKSHEPVN